MDDFQPAHAPFKQAQWCRGAVRAFLCWAVTLGAVRGSKADTRATDEDYPRKIQPLLNQYCYDCHGDGSSKGGVSFDDLSEAALHQNNELWWKVLKNVRAGIMPPHKSDPLPTLEAQQLVSWIKYRAMGIDPANPDPGRVTLRRLNRVEYRNTIRDLMGIEFNTTEEFPPDDTGYGFDTIGDVLSVSPLLLEKYMQAAEKIVLLAVPKTAKRVAETSIPGKQIPTTQGSGNGEHLSFYKAATLATTFKASDDGDYRVALSLKVNGGFDFDPARCNFVFKIDDAPQWKEELGWQEGKKYNLDFPVKWKAGPHRLTLELVPLTPVDKKTTFVDMQVISLDIQGPLDEHKWLPTKNHERFFSRKDAPQNPAEKRKYAAELLEAFATKAYRRPVDSGSVDRLASLAEAVYSQPDKTFEQGVAQGMVAILSSPRFLFRIEKPEPNSTAARYPLVDEYALASRLSYFLWSTMPDAELFDLAAKGELRKNLDAQVKRMIADPRGSALIENFTGQWLQARDVDGISIDARAVLARDKGQEKELQREFEEFRAKRAALEAEAQKTGDRSKLAALKRPRIFTDPAVQLDGPLRQAMRLEPEMVFAAIVKEDRSLAELLDSDYTFLNERLAKHYGIPGVTGPEMRRVTLPKESPRGGLLTMGSVLVVTSNPTRTSPVKRGQFVLDNLLGMPTPPPPADVPALEETEKNFKGHEPTVREALATHRDSALCRSCHARMDPLGFALENFNALGSWRVAERGQPIDASGQLLTGESFTDIRQLKRILRKDHVEDFYRCLTEKLLTYALGRGIEDYDVEAVDRIVEQLKQNDGRFSALLTGVIDSVPFQERRSSASATTRPVVRPVLEQRTHLQVDP
jgi:hypothetical protein